MYWHCSDMVIWYEKYSESSKYSSTSGTKLKCLICWPLIVLLESFTHSPPFQSIDGIFLVQVLLCSLEIIKIPSKWPPKRKCLISGSYKENISSICDRWWWLRNRITNEVNSLLLKSQDFTCCGRTITFLV